LGGNQPETIVVKKLSFKIEFSRRKRAAIEKKIFYKVVSFSEANKISPKRPKKNLRQVVHSPSKHPNSPILKVRKPWQIWWILNLQYILLNEKKLKMVHPVERKKIKNGMKNSMKLIR
jgi:hypothetical protein